MVQYWGSFLGDEKISSLGEGGLGLSHFDWTHQRLEEVRVFGFGDGSAWEFAFQDVQARRSMYGIIHSILDSKNTALRASHMSFSLEPKGARMMMMFPLDVDMFHQASLFGKG